MQGRICQYWQNLSFIQTGLFACDSIQLGQTSSKGVNRAITLVSSRNQRTSQNHTRLCSSSSSVHRYLEISLKDFYDICSVSAWTNTSYFRPSVATFRIRYPTKTWTWPWFQYSEYYREMGREKVHVILHKSGAPNESVPHIICSAEESCWLAKIQVFRWAGSEILLLIEVLPGNYWLFLTFQPELAVDTLKTEED